MGLSDRPLETFGHRILGFSQNTGFLILTASFISLYPNTDGITLHLFFLSVLLILRASIRPFKRLDNLAGLRSQPNDIFSVFKIIRII